MESKKISFGFMKTKKQDKPILVERKEYIDCLEEKSIKMVGLVVIIKMYWIKFNKPFFYVANTYPL